ncbi:MAG: hypothetical protein H6831_03460 [Planctomycetes bacterium]|nr:hypothetical protein [Planctomycetota bacterium]
MIRLPSPARLLLPTALAVCAIVACNSSPGLPEPEDLPGWNGEEEPAELSHRGPRVDLQEAGPYRFVEKLYDRFDQTRAMDNVAFLDRRVRTPGSRDYDEVLDHFAEQLSAAGYGENARFELEWLESELPGPSWRPVKARIAVQLEEGGERELHAFEQRHDVDRVMLPRNAPSCDVTGTVAFSLDELSEGEILFTRTALRADLVQRAKAKGAAAVVSAALAGYNEDFTHGNRHLDAIQYREVDPGTDMPVMQVSQRSYELVESEQIARGKVRVKLEAEVEFGEPTVRTLVATLVGREPVDEAVLLLSHVQEPGASDNASGAAGQLENALVLIEAIRSGHVERLSRSVVFVWGMEFEESRVWLERTHRKPIAAINAVMVGNSRTRTGALPLLERYPDPGAVAVIAPDQHTLWGAGDVDPEWLVPNGISVVARCALVDVSRHVGGTWETFENPWEGGTDHDNLIKAGIPTVLLWHFPDFTFHTSLDRYEMVDGDELQRMSIAALATGLAMADPRPTDLDRYLQSMVFEKRLRVEAATAADRPLVAEAWMQWSLGTQAWFRAHCLGIDLPADAALPIDASEGLEESQFDAEEAIFEGGEEGY